MYSIISIFKLKTHPKQDVKRLFIMKKPSLSEVKEYFKDAETVHTSGGIVEMNLNNIFCQEQLYWVKFRFGWYIIWSETEGYAKILTYKKPSFRPIAMRCNQKQFDAVKPKFKKSNLITESMAPFNNYTYLYNCFKESKISTCSLFYAEGMDFEIHETWNEKVFLEACGIEVEEEETFFITKEQISIIDARISEAGKKELREWFPKAFEEEKKELPKDFTGWCKVDNESDTLWLCFYEKGILKYGFDSNGEWFISDYHESLDGTEREATEQEVFEALKKEAVKRGFVYGKNQYIKDLFNEDKIIETTQTGNFYMHDCESLSVGNMRILNKGTWAEIIPTISLKEAEERLNCKIV